MDSGLIGSEVQILIRPEGLIFNTENNKLGVNSGLVGATLTELREIGAYKEVGLRLHGSGREVRVPSYWNRFPPVKSDINIGLDPSMVFVFPVGER